MKQIQRTLRGLCAERRLLYSRGRVWYSPAYAHISYLHHITLLVLYVYGYSTGTLWVLYVYGYSTGTLCGYSTFTGTLLYEYTCMTGVCVRHRGQRVRAYRHAMALLGPVLRLVHLGLKLAHLGVAHQLVGVDDVREDGGRSVAKTCR